MFKKNGCDSLLEWPTEKGNKITLACGRVLGKGGFGKCYEMYDRESGHRFACKVIDKLSPQYALTKEKVQSQIGIHRRMKHPNIVLFQSYHEDERFIYILLELCSNNTLDDVLHRRKQLHQIQVRYYMRQILEGVKYIHEQRIVHRDLKLQNFFLSDQMTVKIGDFGLAQGLALRARRKSICGTPNYMAPQIFTSREGYSYEVDTWSLGVIAFLLLCGRFPFQDKQPNTIASQLRKGLPFPSRVSELAQSFVIRMLQSNPSDRSTIRQLLNHDFLIRYDIPQTIPICCLVCQPTSTFTAKYVPKKQEEVPNKEQDQQQQKFQFLLQSKESPQSQREASVKLNYKQIQSQMVDDGITQQQYPTQSNEGQAKRICSFGFGYESKQNDSCHIKKWIMEYWEHPRYGLLYRTSDGLLGIRFNDGSNLKMTDHTRQAFIYLSSSNNSHPIHISLASLSSTTKQTRLKLAILTHLLTDLPIEQSCQSGQPLFIRLYLNSLSIFLIWLSNGTLQGKFRDGGELVISPDTCMHIDLRGKIVFPSRNIKDQPMHIQQKIKVIEDVIIRIGRVKKELQIQSSLNSAQSGQVCMV